MQRWIKLPNGSFLDANRICHIGKVETYARLDDEGHNSGDTEYAVTLSTDFPRDCQLIVAGSKEEISTLVRSLLGSNGS